MKRPLIEIRKSRCEDIDRIMTVYDAARAFMRAGGNMTQWSNGYPSRETILADIDAGNHYTGTDPEGEIAMVFAFIVGDDPTYAIIEDGTWPDDSPYGTIHRLASSGRHAGMLAVCTAFAMKQAGTVRLDTHTDNHAMRMAAERLGFVRCGTIYCQDGTPRIAYQLNAEA